MRNYGSNGFSNFKAGFGSGFANPKFRPSQMNGLGRFAFNAGSKIGAATRLVGIGGGKFFSAAKNLGGKIGKFVTIAGQKFKVIGTTIYRGVKGFILKLVQIAKTVGKNVKYGSKVAKYVDNGFTKLADKTVPKVKQYTSNGKKKTAWRMHKELKARNKVVEKRAELYKGIAGGLAASGIVGSIAAVQNGPSKEDKE